MVARLGDLDHRGHPAQLLVHGGADVGRDQPVLRAQESQAAVDGAEVGRGDGAHAEPELLEDPTVEFPLPATLDLLERLASDEVHHVVEVVLLGRHGAEMRHGVIEVGVGPRSPEGLAQVESADLGVELGHR